MTTQILVFTALLLAAPPAATAAQRASGGRAAEPAAAAQAPVDEQTARETRERLQLILQQYPPSVGQVLRLDPSLLTKPDYLAPYPTMPSRIALTAWTRLETLDGVDEARVERFIRAYRGIDHHAR